MILMERNKTMVINKFTNVAKELSLEEIQALEGRVHIAEMSIDGSYSTINKAFGIDNGRSIYEEECNCICDAIKQMQTMRGQRNTIVTIRLFFGDDQVSTVLENALLSSINLDVLRQMLASFTPNGYTPLAQTVLEMCDHSERLYKSIRSAGGDATYPMFVLFTDGQATDTDQVLESANQAMDALYAGARPHVTFIAVGISKYAGDKQEFPHLERLAKGSGETTAVISDLSNFREMAAYIPATMLAVANSKPKPVLPSGLRPQSNTEGVSAGNEADAPIPVARHASIPRPAAAPRPVVGGRGAATVPRPNDGNLRPYTPPRATYNHNNMPHGNAGNQAPQVRPYQAPQTSWGRPNVPQGNQAPRGSIADLPSVDITAAHRKMK